MKTTIKIDTENLDGAHFKRWFGLDGGARIVEFHDAKLGTVEILCKDSALAETVKHLLNAAAVEVHYTPPVKWETDPIK